MSAYYNRKPKIGDYVLATKYADGDTEDHFCVGWLKAVLPYSVGDRFDVVDAAGKSFRGNGFRRIKPISEECGRWIVNHIREMEQSERSVWSWLRQRARAPTTEDTK